ncbi:MAG: lysoplasmalogenase [Lutibacter sp.]|uniref:lysoplasmalogenase n=1 Tax=Lutibacter sp. TaxID=1925666 RepID=UPI00185A5C36|nr:lysoplasmalogenase [Lutibacter sp.]MBT8317128.1 lysoplasmalogenase [Lutibacter sp.]NNJ57988.1 lysoplasmalogenase [Lutibacter sp.]
MDKIKVTFFVFVLVSILDIIGIILEIPFLRYIFKPLIILSLLFLYTFSVQKRLKWYLFALGFSFLGDVLLMFEGELFFITGLVSFLIAHFLFIKIVLSRIQKYSVLKIIFSIIPFFIVFSLLIFTLKNSLDEMLIPVIIYGLTISTLGVVSLIDFMNNKSRKSLLMFLGAIVFMLSDSVLAIDKFYFEEHFNKIVIMFTYVLAQYLIFRSMIFGNEITDTKENE